MSGLEPALAPYRLILDASSDGILIVDAKGTIVAANSRIVDWLGITREGLVGLTLDEFLNGPLKGVASEDESSDLATAPIPGSRPVELRVHRPLSRVLEWRVEPFPGEYEGSVVHLFSDKTDHRHLLELTTTFASTISHDIRLPITLILGYAQSLRRRLDERDSPERDIQELDALISNTRRLNLMVTQIVDAMRLDGGLTDLVLTEVDLSALVASALHKVKRQYPAAEIETHIQEVPITMGDQQRIEQSVMTLIANSIRHGQPPRQLAVYLKEKVIVLEVSDRGPGIEPSRLATLLSSTRRNHTASSGSEGLGLGLHNASVTANLLGGRLEIESTPGSGTTARLVVPVS